MTFPEAGTRAIIETYSDESERQSALNHWDREASNLSLNQARALANKLGFELSFDWDECRSEEGFYKIKGNVEYCIKRGLVSISPTPNHSYSESS